MSPATPALLALSVAGFLGHLWLGERLRPSLLKAAIKTACIAAMAVIAALEGGPALLVAGLALGALGDALLVGEGDRFLLPGMGAFALGHAAYVALFLIHGDGTPDLAISAAALLAGLIMLGWLWPHLGAMRVPVILYTAIIAAMSIAAGTLQGPARLALAGAALFMLSDALLAGHLFRPQPDPIRTDRPTGPAHRLSAAAVWISYAGAQALITLAFLPHLRA